MPSSRSFSLLVAATLVVACDEDPTRPGGSGSIDVEPQTIVVAPGDSVLVAVVVRDADGDPIPDAPFELSSSDESVAFVDANGYVHGVEFGSAELTVTSGELSAEADIAVQLPAAEVALDLGDWHSCRLTGAGVAACWGQASFGQLGIGVLPQTQCNASACSMHPVSVAGGRSFSSISAGAAHTCAVTVLGEAYCWGANYDGTLGVPASGTCEFDAPCNLAPTRVAPGIAFRSIAAGAHFTCGLAIDGTAWCWGANFSGNLGDGTQEPVRTTPVEVAGDHSFVALAAGGSHACGIDDEGAAWCWGARTAGQVGDGVAGGESEPAWAPVAVSGELTFRAIVAGESHTCALTDDGAVWCWGLNESGQLGTDESQECPGFFGAFACSPTPVFVTAGLRALAAGGNHSCAITIQFHTFCWGQNLSGQLGTGSYEPESAAVPVRVTGHHDWEAVSIGNSHTCAAVAGTRDVYCWGDNFLGQLGLGDTEGVPAPMAVLP